MDSTLAKELKDMGFVSIQQAWCDAYQEVLPVPLLEELIAACDGKNGQRFRWLKNEKTHWLAQARPPHESPMPRDIIARGSTPIEAVARLWLVLNKK